MDIIERINRLSLDGKKQVSETLGMTLADLLRETDYLAWSEKTWPETTKLLRKPCALSDSDKFVLRNALPFNASED